MRPVRLVFALVLATCGLLAQTATGGIRGVVTLPDGPVSRATVQGTHGSSGRTFGATTATSGRFALTVLPEGTYDVSVPEIGLTTTRVVRRDVMVHAGAVTPLDITLTKGNFGIIGDDNAYLAIRSKYANVRGPAPRPADRN